MKGKPTLVLDTRRISTTGDNAGKFHVKLRACFRVVVDGKNRWVHRLFPTGVYAATGDDLLRIQTKPKKSESEMQDALLKVLAKGKEILEREPNIDPESFSHQLTMKGSYEDPLGAMEAYSEELRGQGQAGTADYYDQARSSFQKFANKYYGGRLSFAMINRKTLLKYERWMLEQGRSVTTVGMYTTALRTVYNIPAIKKKLPVGMYPFGKDNDKYQIPTSRGRKIALTEEQKNKVLTYKTLNPATRKAVDLWIFSYFCNGMNFADIARLKYGHIRDGILLFERTKTIRKRVKAPIVVTLRPECLEIIRVHGNGDPGNMNDYIFGVLKDGLTPEQVRDRVHDFIADTNEDLEKACGEMEIPAMTTYWARHTYATIARNKGASIEFIQEALGHADTKTTQNYLDSFDIETKRKISNLL